VRRLTLAEVNEQFGGVIPPDAVLSGTDEQSVRTAPSTRAKRRLPKSGRFTVLTAFADAGLTDLTGAEVKVWLILFRDTKAATGIARTGQADIAHRTGLSRRGVQRALGRLIGRGMVIIVQRGRLNKGPSVYRVHPTGTA
jgi:hypothetical protein